MANEGGFPIGRVALALTNKRGAPVGRVALVLHIQTSEGPRAPSWISIDIYIQRNKPNAGNKLQPILY